MPCFHPQKMRFEGSYYDTGGRKMHMLGRLMPGEYESFVADYGTSIVPCKRCIGCRIDYSREWANRMIMELDHSKVAIFVTLTYNDKNVPLAMIDSDGKRYNTLNKAHLKNFWKLLRYYFPDKEIRYYAAGEYGSKTFRPHYHAIIFGLSLADFPDAYIQDYNDIGQPYFVSPKFSEIWGYGFTMMSAVSWKTCAYVSRYCLKKKYKNEDALYYASKNVIPEFSTMSLKPGIGMYYLTEHIDFTSMVSINDGTEVVNFPLPTKLLEKYYCNSPEEYDKIKELRKELAMSRVRLELDQTDLDYIDLLGNKEKELINRLKPIKERM